MAIGWVRSGECNQCGECCRGDASWFVAKNPDTTPAMKRDPPVAGYCPAYENGGCADHAARLPNSFYVKHLCDKFPLHPGQIEGCPSCSYKFTWV